MENEPNEMSEESKLENPKAFPHFKASNRKYVGEVDGQPMYHVTDEKAVEGMDLRDCFANNAPDVPNWYVPSHKGPVKPPTWDEAVSAGVSRKEWGESWNKWGVEFSTYEMSTLTAWRYYYADAMLKERAKK